MSFSKLTKMNFLNMFKRKEFFFVSLISFLLFLVPVFLDLLKLYQKDISGIRPPWFYFGFSLSSGITFDSPLVYQAAFSLIVPLLSCMAYSYCYFDEEKYRLSNIIVCKTGRTRYYLSSALVSFLGGFIVIFIPLVLSILVLLIAVPVNAYAPIDTMSAFKNDAYSCIQILPSLANNHPYLYNILYIFIASLFCALIGLLSYSLSLYWRKNKFIAVSLPFIIYIILSLALEIFASENWALPNVMLPSYNLKGVTLPHLLIPLVLLTLINALAIIFKIKVKKDEL